ncbi:hypothetical protein PV341_13055 [Streptomyces sp. PA03-1a]|nr:hypothetical protein [Streptomyces sp. PA03-1a]
MGAASAFLGVHAGHSGFAMMALDDSPYVIREFKGRIAAWLAGRTPDAVGLPGG